MISKFNQIKQRYDEYYKEILRSGQLLVRDTAKGIWGYSGSDEIFEFFKKIQLEKYKNFLDLGSGDGKVVAIASLFTKASGVEFDEGLHEDAVKLCKGLKVNLIKSDYMEHDLSKYDIIFINPDKGFHHGLEDKLLKELNGILFIYNEVFQPRFLKKGKTFWVNQMPIISYSKRSI